MQGQWRGTPVAIKKIFDPVITDELLEEIQNEIRMLSLLRHPNICLLMGISSDLPNIMIVTEFASKGSLYDRIQNHKSELTKKQKISIGRDVAIAMAFIHDTGIVHRDLKSHNILIDEGDKIKVCDFGLARFKADLNTGLAQFSGTPAYMAPEIYKKKSYDEKVDIFAFGCLLYELVQRDPPFSHLEPDDIKHMVTKGEPLDFPYGTD